MKSANDNLRQILPQPDESLLAIPICEVCGQQMQYTEIHFFKDKSKSIKKANWNGHEKCYEQLRNIEKQNYEQKEQQRRDEIAKKLIAEAFSETTLNPVKRTLDNFIQDEKNNKAFQTILSWKYPEKGFLLFGKPGTGKTHMLCGLVRKLCTANQLNCRIIQVRPWLDRVLQQTYEKAETLLNDVANCSVLILDDIGAGSLTEAADERLQRILDARIEFDKPTFASTNLTGADFKTILSPRTLSRALGAMTPLEVGGSDHRR